MIEQVYAPPSVTVFAPGDGNRVLLCEWPAMPHLKILLVLEEKAAKVIAEQLLAPSIAIASELPPGLRGI